MTDQELIGYLDRRFGEISQLREEIHAFRAETTQRIEGLHEENRQTRAALGETRAALEEENRQTRTALEEENRQTRVMMEGIRSEMQLVAEGVMGQGEVFAARLSETLQKIDEVKALVVPLYQDMNRRVKILEERAERQTRDVVDVIRERFGKH